MNCAEISAGMFTVFPWRSIGGNALRILVGGLFLTFTEPFSPNIRARFYRLRPVP